MNTILTKTDVENLIPDYVFGKLSQDEVLQFEQAITLYPDLQSEIDEIQQTFAKVNSLDFQTSVEQRTRNLSLRVNERLNAEKNNRLNIYFNRFVRTALPALGVVILAIVFVRLYSSSNQSPDMYSAEKSNHLEIIRPNDAQLIINDTISISAVIEETSKLVTLQDNVPEAATAIDELLAGALQNWNENSTSGFVPNDDIWLNFTDTELQDIMKDLSYENPTIL